jgi:Uma2 family endonuclease
LWAGRVRIPDVAFFSWKRLPGRRPPTEPIPTLAPDLAIEILSPSNTHAEMLQKREDYFAAGVGLVWEVDPRGRTISVYDSPASPSRICPQNEVLDAGDILPGFTLSLAELFAELSREG